MDESRHVTMDEQPQRIRTFLPGYVTVGGTLWSTLPRVRIERGGGFYHFGVVVYPTGEGPSPTRWKRVFGWPPEVVVYHEE
jgi:hypothetical protein